MEVAGSPLLRLSLYVPPRKKGAPSFRAFCERVGGNTASSEKYRRKELCGNLTLAGGNLVSSTGKGTASAVP